MQNIGQTLLWSGIIAALIVAIVGILLLVERRKRDSWEEVWDSLTNTPKYTKEDMWKMYQAGANAQKPVTDEWKAVRRAKFEYLISHWNEGYVPPIKPNKESPWA